MNKSQKGFGLVEIIVVVLVLGLIGALVWLSLSEHNDQNNTATTNTSPSQTTQQTKTNPNDGYLVIKEWGVRLKPSAALSDLTYVQAAEMGPDHFSFSTEKINAVDPTCSGTTAGYSALGDVYRTTSPDENDHAAVYENGMFEGGLIKKIGDYSYYYVTPQSTCQNQAADQLLIDGIKEFKSVVLTLSVAQQ